MGNKDPLAAKIVSLTRELTPNAPLVDVFGGMCSVAGATADTGRQAWANDVQHFAVLTGRALLTSRRPPPSRSKLERALAVPYRANLHALKQRFSTELRAERRILQSDRFRDYAAASRTWPHVGNDLALAAEAAALRTAPTTFPYRLATITFAWGYFGLHQAMQLDSLRYAIDTATAERALTREEARWCRLSLLGAASRIASSPGHFAQYLRGDTPESFARIKLQRRRAAWDWCLEGLGRLRPFGTAEWRRENRVFRSDALKLWPRLDRAGVGNAVVYADPPYSKEHYSRYYHVLESLERYDYPVSDGAGRYRDDRFRTAFSVKGQVTEATERLCANVAERGWTLILSYPSSGLLTKTLGIDLRDLLRDHFSHVRLAFRAPTAHSTMGARHGSARKVVEEFVWLAA